MGAVGGGETLAPTLIAACAASLKDPPASEGIGALADPFFFKGVGGGGRARRARRGGSNIVYQI